MFWRETGTNDDEDDVEAREGACSIETAMAGRGCRGEGDGQGGDGDFVSLCARSRSGGLGQSATATGIAATTTGELQREGPSSERSRVVQTAAQGRGVQAAWVLVGLI